MMQPLHILIYDGRDADLSERWCCPACGRVILLDWARHWWDVRRPGDETTRHTGGRQ